MFFKIGNYVFEYPKPRFDLTLAIIKYLEFKVNETVSELETLEEVREIAGIGKKFKGNNGQEFDYKVVFNVNKISKLVKKLDSLIDSFSSLIAEKKLKNNATDIEILKYIKDTLTEVGGFVAGYKFKLLRDIEDGELTSEKMREYEKVNIAVEGFNNFLEELNNVFISDNIGSNLVFNKNDKLYNILMNTKRYKIEKLNIPNNPIIGENLACEEKR